MNNEQYGRHMGYFQAANDVLNLLNTMEERRVPKAKLYAAVSALRPPLSETAQRQQFQNFARD
ncbi:hypothetical protein [Mesorhizobium sp. M7A.F.Ca.CA.004.02.1.1]|uniref:hypothetical protein n=1 Tax=Mesorhizobium sp. M7A.F.Ca.CA.004.02.1.1 TaxID=2496690 RepID=UPI000FCAB62A|nr:hypothetical protein [Mesorhizobium sp. M7A.F.Ca.CA.004.02.1.1]RVB02848.1 hypothetical protein EN912_10375 [Mesorhizobium sp. M7A.F.Ca.CA.004.02.1.1]